MNNIRIRTICKESGVYMYELAQEIGVHPQTLILWMREELTGERLDRVLTALDRLAEKKHKTIAIDFEKERTHIDLEIQIKKLNDRVATLETIVNQIFNSHALIEDREDALRKSWKGAL